MNLLVVDRSALVRQVLTDIFYVQPAFTVNVCVDTGLIWRSIDRHKPDLVVLELGNPVEQGWKLMTELKQKTGLPVLALLDADQGPAILAQTLALGAFDCFVKPCSDIRQRLLARAEELCAKVRQLSELVAASESQQRQPRCTNTPPLIAIGASTGGVQAIKQLLEQLPVDCPGVIITQHIPADFAHSFAAGANAKSRLKVSVAQNRQRILPGHAYIAPGDQHLTVERDAEGYCCKLLDSEPVNFHRPSVDVMFDSVAEHTRGNAVAVMLTGMGKDGARAMLRLRQCGNVTLAQDQASSVVWGMPGEAVKLGAVEQQLPLEAIPATITERLQRYPQSA